jgi:hypothetical protein
MHDDSESPALVRIAVARDHAQAEAWAQALEAAGIDTAIEIDDGTYASTLGSAFGGQSFVYPVLVEASRRSEAARVLVDLGERGPFYRRRPDWTSALLVTSVALLLVVALVTAQFPGAAASMLTKVAIVAAGIVVLARGARFALRD